MNMEKQTEPEEMKKEIASLKRRLTSALKQRDEWAAKYAGVMQEKQNTQKTK